MRLKSILALCLISVVHASCEAQDWSSLWRSYVAGFMDNQTRVIDHDAGDRSTSEGQAYGMFFALVANDRSHFDGLLRWTERSLAGGDLSTHLPAWLWGHEANNQWGVLDQHGNAYRLNASYMPLQIILGLSHFVPDGPWEKVAASVPIVVSESAPHGFVADWTDFKTAPERQSTPGIGSYDAIRVYLWAGMLDAATPNRDSLLKSILGMVKSLRTNPRPPAKVRPDGSIEDPYGPVGFSAALLPYAAALHEDQIQNQLMSQVQSQLKPQTGLCGPPARYYDQNLALFGLGFLQQQFSFDSEGALKLKWKSD